MRLRGLAQSPGGAGSFSSAPSGVIAGTDGSKENGAPVSSSSISAQGWAWRARTSAHRACTAAAETEGGRIGGGLPALVHRFQECASFVVGGTLDVGALGFGHLIPCQRIAFDVVFPLAKLEKNAGGDGIVAARLVGNALIGPAGKQPQALKVETLRIFLACGSHLYQKVGNGIFPADGC